MTILSKLTKPALKRQMASYEKKLRIERSIFLINEVNDSDHLHEFLEDVYQDIEPIYKEIMRRYHKPLSISVPSKINTEEDDTDGFVKYMWDMKKQ